MISRFLCGIAGLASVLAAAQAQTPVQKRAIQQLQQQQQRQNNQIQQLLKARGKQADPILVNTAAQQAEALKKAFVALAMANHDYNGHRARAMESVRAAYKELDKVINKRGTALQKAKSQQEDALAAAAKQAAKQAPPVHENQVFSDNQLLQAADILIQLSVVYTQQQQQKLLGHVSNSLNEITVALQIR